MYNLTSMNDALASRDNMKQPTVIGLPGKTKHIYQKRGCCGKEKYIGKNKLGFHQFKCVKCNKIRVTK